MSASDRIISARFQMATGALTICQVYAPIAEADDDDTDAFYTDLQQEIHRIRKKDHLISMGDFNAKIGTGDESTKAVMGMHGIGTRNDSGERLLDFCYANDL